MKLTYVSKFMVEQEVFSSLANFVALPTDKLGLERFEDSGSWACTVDENQTETSCGMFETEASQNIGTEFTSWVVMGILRLMRK